MHKLMWSEKIGNKNLSVVKIGGVDMKLKLYEVSVTPVWVYQIQEFCWQYQLEWFQYGENLKLVMRTASWAYGWKSVGWY